MADINDGGSAFPGERHVRQDGHLIQETDPGMSLRDYFAAKAMSAVPDQTPYNMKPNEGWHAYIARQAYTLADAMLRARSQP